MAIRAVIFDIGGVLEREVETEMDAKWEARLDLNAGELSEVLMNSNFPLDATLGKFSEQEMLAQLGAVLGIDAEQVDEFMNDIWEQYEFNSEVAKYFQQLRPRYKTAILSNAWPDARWEEHHRFHFDEMADMVIYSFEEKMMKPDARLFQLACERLGVLPEETVFLDDVERNVEGACSIGIHAIHFKSNEQALADVQALLDAQ